MSRSEYFDKRQAERAASTGRWAKEQDDLIATNIKAKCRCGGLKLPDHPVCHACFTSVPATVRKNFNSNDPRKRRVALRNLLEHASAKGKQPKRADLEIGAPLITHRHD